MKNNASAKSKSHARGVLLFGLNIIGCFALLAMSSCSTMSGFGRDVETTGEQIQEAAH